jgi:hypothetical protein
MDPTYQTPDKLIESVRIDLAMIDFEIYRDPRPGPLRLAALLDLKIHLQRQMENLKEAMKAIH